MEYWAQSFTSRSNRDILYSTEHNLFKQGIAHKRQKDKEQAFHINALYELEEARLNKIEEDGEEETSDESTPVDEGRGEKQPKRVRIESESEDVEKGENPKEDSGAETSEVAELPIEGVATGQQQGSEADSVQVEQEQGDAEQGDEAKDEADEVRE
jgi:hypothetical protein